MRRLRVFFDQRNHFVIRCFPGLVRQISRRGNPAGGIVPYIPLHDSIIKYHLIDASVHPYGFRGKAFCGQRHDRPVDLRRVYFLQGRFAVNGNQFIQDMIVIVLRMCGKLFDVINAPLVSNGFKGPGGWTLLLLNLPV